jgi:hypothetical protein
VRQPQGSFFPQAIFANSNRNQGGTMGKKPEPAASDVSAKKVVSSKTPEAAASPIEIQGGEIDAAEIPASQINHTDIGTTLAEEAVRIGAYFRWDAAGRPGGDGVRFWLEAEQELIAGGAIKAQETLQSQ